MWVGIGVGRGWGNNIETSREDRRGLNKRRCAEERN